MIYQYKLNLGNKGEAFIQSNEAYKLYAWLLSVIPSEDAEILHNSSNAISQYLSHNQWTINVSDDYFGELIGNSLKNLTEINLNNEAFKINDMSEEIISARELLQCGQNVNSNRAELEFLTPTAFKQAGRYRIFPDEELIIQSLLKHWNQLDSDYLLEDEDMLEAMKQGIHITDYRLQTGRYGIKDTAIPGVYGKIVITTRLPIAIRDIWNTLLYFSEYCGVGIKTTLGMGGVKLRS